ncbi:MAG: hypothetical protein AB8B60_04915 [Sulfitobacter sp.]
MSYSCLRTIAAVFLIFFQASQLQAEPHFFGSGAKVLILDDGGLSSKQKKALRSFVKKAGYFGAFAASTTTGRWDWHDSFSSQADVREFVLEKCKILGGANDCKLVAISLPKSVANSTVNAVGLSSRQQEYFKDTYLKGARRYPRGYAAFAINGFFAVGRWGRGHKETAIARAMSDCRRYGARLKGTDKPEVYQLRLRLGLLDCKIVDVRRQKDLN